MSKGVHGLPQVGRGRAKQRAGQPGGIPLRAGQQPGEAQAEAAMAMEQQRWAGGRRAAGEETGTATMTQITRTGAAAPGQDLGRKKVLCSVQWWN